MENVSDKVYNVTKSKTVRMITSGMWFLLMAVFVPVWYMFLCEPFNLTAFIIMSAATLFALGVVLYYWFISPKGVELTDDALVLHRVLGRKVFRYADIADAGLWTGKPSCLFRFCGSGAFCGFIGWFSGGGLGTHFEYVGSYADAFYIRLRRGRTYLLSCDVAEMAMKRVREGMQGKEC